MQLFFHPDLSQPSFLLPEEESKHLIRVLRKKQGDEILVIDGKGNLAHCVIASVDPKRCELRIGSSEEKEKLHRATVHLVIAPTKNFDRMEWMLEKCIEIGLDELTFIETSNSERVKVNLERCHRIAISAIKQSKQFHLPKINAPVSFKEFMTLHSNQAGFKAIAWCETDQSTPPLNTILNAKMNSSGYTFLIGPEGDFTNAEIALAISHHFTPISLGKSILRTETAGVFIASAIGLINAN